MNLMLQANPSYTEFTFKYLINKLRKISVAKYLINLIVQC